MAIFYEINPPRITDGQQGDLNERISRQMERVGEISSLCGGIHVTDSVLGTRRVPAIEVARQIKERYGSLEVTISVRVRDRNLKEVEELVRYAASAGLDGALILMGDPSQSGDTGSGLVPSEVAGNLMRNRPGLKVYLSLPSSPNMNKIQRKISARPDGFVTQVIRSEEQVELLCGELKPHGFRMIPCLLLPSEKNASSAKFLGLDWSHYSADPAGFISRIHWIAGDVLITSPNDFAAARDTLRGITRA